MSDRPLRCRLGLHRWRHGHYATPAEEPPPDRPASPFPLTYWRRGCTRCGARARARFG